MKFITPLAAGTGTDPAMRIVIDQLGKMWGQQTVLVNQPGAGGALAARAAHRRRAGRPTLLMAVASTFTSFRRRSANCRSTSNDFVPIGFVGEVPMAIAVTPTLPVRSLSELIAHSKKQPGGLNVASRTRGGMPHLTAELFRSRSGADLTRFFTPALRRP